MVLVWSAVMVGAAPAARACSCARLDPVDGVRKADAAFVGTFLGTFVGKDEPAASNGGLVNSAQVVGYHFEVERVIKGDLGSTVTVHAAVDGASCGLEFHRSPRTGVLLTDDGGRWRSSLCAQYDADALLAAAGTSPSLADTGTDAHPGTVALVLTLLGSLALVARRSVRRSG